MSFESFLRHQRRTSPSTAYRSAQQARSFDEWLANKGWISEELTHKHILDYISFCKSKNNTHNTICRKLRTIRQYLDYKYIVPNPCDRLQLNSRPGVLPHPLLTEKEVNELYRSYPEWTVEMKRDKVVLGIMCYQAPRTGEMRNLALHDVSLDMGFIRIKGGGGRQPDRFRSILCNMHY